MKSFNTKLLKYIKKADYLKTLKKILTVCLSIFCAFSTVQVSFSVSSIRALVCDIFSNMAIAPGI